MSDSALLLPNPKSTPAQRYARGALAAALFGLGLWTIHGFIAALVWATILAIALWPLYERLHRRCPKTEHNLVAPAIATTLTALVVIVPFGFFAVEFWREARFVLDWVEQAQTSGAPVPSWLAGLPWGARPAAAWWNSALGTPEAAAEFLARLHQPEMMAYSRHLGSLAAHRVVLFGFAILTLFFLFKDGDDLTRQMRTASLRAFGARGEHIALQMAASVHGTVDGLVLVGIGEGVLLGIAYALAGAPHPAILGAVTAVAAMIPFGAPLVFGSAALLVLAQGSQAGAIGIALFGVVVTFVADHFVRPVLIGGATRLPFVWVLFGILGGVETWGLLGLFLGPAVMAALILLWREWVAPSITE